MRLPRPLRRFLGSGTSIAGLCISLALVVVALLGPALVGDGGLAPDLDLDLAGPARAGGLGRGENGVDVITWLIYAAYLHFRFMGWVKGPVSTLWNIIGFGAVLFTYIGVSFLLPGLHSYLQPS